MRLTKTIDQFEQNIVALLTQTPEMKPKVPDVQPRRS